MSPWTTILVCFVVETTFNIKGSEPRTDNIRDLGIRSTRGIIRL
ncbi:MAG: hypothetical protein ACI9LE_000201 [Paraglaciecola sp.]|jgi:hypothetical protein